MNDATQFFDTAAGGGPGYPIDRSLRFNSADTAYLSRTPPSAGNRKTWTWSGWVKRSKLGASQSIFGATPDNYVNNYTFLRFSYDSLYINDPQGGGRQTTALYRDLSAWMHIVVALDTTQPVGSDRLKLYVNNSLPAYSGADPDLNADWSMSSDCPHYVNAIATPGATYGQALGDQYLANIHFIDGQALDPTSFGEFDTNGVWQPKAYAGTYGTNGFHLTFSDNSTAAALGTDTSGNGNDWTVNNLSVTAGADNDSLVDSPTNYGEDLGVGGEVRGNYATLNPLWFYATANTGTLSNGNLEYAGPGSAWGSKYSTIGVASGKWYFEASPTTSGPTFMVGIVTAASPEHVGTTGFAYYVNGNKYNYGSVSAYGATYTTGDIIGVAFDLDAGSITFYKNGTSQGTAFTGVASGTYYPGISCFATTGAFNAGQRPFAYTAPSGFKALCTANLAEPTIADGSTAMDVVLDTGANILSAAQGAIGGNADLLWIKDRANSNNHQLIDTVRGGTATLQSNTITVETTYVAPAGSSVAWTWNAGSSTVTNNDGSISAQVRANPNAGFSIVTYTGNRTAGATVGHGLGVEPGLLIVKNRDGTYNWATRFNGFLATEYLELDTLSAINTDSTIWSGTLPTSAVFSVGASDRTNATGERYVAYCFAPVDGYSSFGSYIGNGVSDGPFVYTGFRPRFVLIKLTTSTQSWLLFDALRPGYNVIGGTLYPDSTSNEALTGQIDFVANGFKLRSFAGGENNSGATHYYAAFAEHPFAASRAR